MSLPSASGSNKPAEDTAMNVDAIWDGVVVSVETEVTFESVVGGEEETSGLAFETNGIISTNIFSPPPPPVLGSALAAIPEGDRERLESEMQGSKIQTSPDMEDGSEVDRAAGAAGEETTSFDGNLELGDNMVELRCNSAARGGQCTVYLVGTAHVSKASCHEVQAVIRHVKPQIVFLELCASRHSMVYMPRTLKVPTFEEMIHMYRKKDMNPFGVIYSWFLAKVADKLEVSPGSEFRVAYEEAIACGARVTLGDRPVQVTLRRTWAAMSTWHKAKLIFILIFQGFFMPSAEELNKMVGEIVERIDFQVEEMKDTDMITAVILEMSKSFPSLMDTLVRERDLYMAATLRGVAQTSSTVVAVVGKGHLRGISNNWEKDIPIRSLLTIPKRKPSWFARPVVRWGTVAIAVGGLAIFVGVHFNRKS